MKHIIFTLAILAVASTCASTSTFAQFRNDPSTNEPPINTTDAMKGGDSFWSSFFDPNKFSMHQSYSMGFVSGGGGSTGLTMFTNTFSYKALDNLVISADVSAAYSPYSSFCSAYSNSLNGVYLSNARLDWKINDNTYMRVQYVGGPQTGMGGFGGFSPYYNPFYSPAQPTSASATVNVH
jgi:hypothetical protein